MKKTSLIIISYGILIACISIISCKHDVLIPADYGYKGPCNCPDDFIQPIPCNPDSIYFVNTILPLIEGSCGKKDIDPACHATSPDSEKKLLTNYSTIMQSDYIKPGDGSGSDMYEKLVDTDPQDRMPPSPYSALTPDQINLIKKWIDQGAKNNYCTSCDTTAFKFNSIIWPIISNNCYSCHSGATPKKGVSITNYSEVNALVLDGRLKNVLYGTNGYKLMPPAGKLNSCNLTKINNWITNGAPND